MLTPEEENEIAELARQYGTPLRWTREFFFNTERNREWARKTAKRRGEIILVVPRPGNRVLLHTKSTYPDAVYRLPGGGVNPNEAAEPAARREAREETGFEVKLTRFLGLVENVFNVDGDKLSYPSYVFLTQPTTEPPRVMDPDEQIAGFSEVPVEELKQVAERLHSLPPDWQPWGQFRAVPHELVVEVLARA